MSRKHVKQAATTRVAIFTSADQKGPFRAGIVINAEPEAAHAAARSHALASVDLDDRLPPGIDDDLPHIVITEQGELEVPEVEEYVADALTQLAVLQGRIKPAAPSAVGGQGTVEAPTADEGSNAAGAGSQASEGTLQAAGEEVPAIAPLISDELARETWSKIAVGHVVLAPDHVEGEFAGLWPATVVRRTAKQVTLRWMGQYADQPEVVRPMTSIALMHPAYVQSLRNEQ